MPRLDAGLVRSAVRRRVRRHRRRGGILMYHRVVDADFDRGDLRVAQDVRRADAGAGAMPAAPSTR